MLIFAISKERELTYQTIGPGLSETASTSAHGPIIPRRVSAERIIESFFVIMPHDAGLHGQAAMVVAGRVMIRLKTGSIASVISSHGLD